MCVACVRIHNEYIPNVFIFIRTIRTTIQSATTVDQSIAESIELTFIRWMEYVNDLENILVENSQLEPQCSLFYAHLRF